MSPILKQIAQEKADEARRQTAPTSADLEQAVAALAYALVADGQDGVPTGGFLNNLVCSMLPELELIRDYSEVSGDDFFRPLVTSAVSRIHTRLKLATDHVGLIEGVLAWTQEKDHGTLEAVTQ